MTKDSVVLERRFVPKGTLVMRQGDPGNCAYLIQSGSVSVYTEHDGRRVELAQLELGQIFGEMALIFDDPRTASVKTLEDTSLIIITRESFRKKLERSDSTISAIVHMLTERMISSNDALINKKTNSKDLMNTTRIIYQNVLASLPPEKKDVFQAAVLPKLDAFMESVRSFQEK